jgi:hypothetical protein
MATLNYRYSFTSDAPIDEVEETLLLAILAAQGLYGEARTRLDVKFTIDVEESTCLIDASTAVGRDVNRLFVNLVMREFGNDSFTVTRVEKEPQEVAA